MFRAAVAVFLAFLSTACLAQQNCPFTPAPATSNAFCANTAFVGRSAGTTVVLTGVNFNSAASTTVSFSLPAAHYSVRAIVVRGTSGTFGTAKAGLFTATGGGGTAIASQQAISISSTSDNTSGNEFSLTVSPISLNVTPLYFTVGTPQGAAAVGNVYIYLQPES